MFRGCHRSSEGIKASPNSVIPSLLNSLGEDASSAVVDKGPCLADREDLITQSRRNLDKIVGGEFSSAGWWLCCTNNVEQKAYCMHPIEQLVVQWFIGLQIRGNTSKLVKQDVAVVEALPVTHHFPYAEVFSLRRSSHLRFWQDGYVQVCNTTQVQSTCKV